MITIITQYGEIFDKVLGVVIRNMSNTEYERNVYCYKVETKPNIGWGKSYRYIPVEQVVEIIDKDNNHFVRKER